MVRAALEHNDIPDAHRADVPVLPDPSEVISTDDIDTVPAYLGEDETTDITTGFEDEVEEP